jgi:hypothetical protein
MWRGHIKETRYRGDHDPDIEYVGEFQKVTGGQYLTTLQEWTFEVEES